MAEFDFHKRMQGREHYLSCLQTTYSMCTSRITCRLQGGHAIPHRPCMHVCSYSKGLDTSGNSAEPGISRYL